MRDINAKPWVVTWLLFVTTLYVFYPPYWSLMDDMNNMRLLHGPWASLTWIEAIESFVSRETHMIGMFRPVYPAYAYWFYRLFENAPFIAYRVLGVAIFGLLWGWALLFERLSKWPSGSRWVYFFLACIFTPHFNLLLHASLLEKFLIAAGLGYGFALVTLTGEKLSWRQFFICSTLLLLSAALGFLSKPNAIFLVAPVGLYLFFESLRTKDSKRWGLLFFFVVLNLALGWAFLSIRSPNYTSRYDMALLPQRLLAPHGRFLMFEIVALIGLISALSDRPSHLFKGRWSWNAGRLFWPTGLFAFVLVMMPWEAGLGSYYSVPGGVFLVGCFSQVLYWLATDLHLRWPRLIPWSVAAVLISLGIVSGIIFSRRMLTHNGTPLVARWIHDTAAQAKEPVHFLMPTPCEEEHASLAEISGAPIEIARANKVPNQMREGLLYMVTLRACAPRPIEGFEFSQPVFQRGYWQVFATQN